MSADLDQDKVGRLLEACEAEVSSGRLPACQVALAKDGETVVRRTFGAPEDSRFTVFSVTKALTAAVVWLFLAEQLRPETRVAELVPEFAREGFDAVTLEHLLTHTCGFPRAPMRLEEGATSEGRCYRFGRWRLDWEPGSRTVYHPTAAHWVLAEVVEQVAGQEFLAVVRDRVIEPLGLSALRLGLGADDAPVLDVAFVGHPTELDLPVVAIDEHLLLFNHPAVRAVGVPGAGAVSTAEDVTLLYQAFLHDPKGLWDPAVLADATGVVRNSLPDRWTGVPANRTLGLVVAGDDGNAVMRSFGSATGPRAFGASGLGGQVAWADPDSGLSFCFLTNGLDEDQVASFTRSSRISTYAARCADPGATP
ncbi:MAG TPA: serine hydrolase domain-containing protein [Mycobacteriales bacterium]|nr:serine hydrolase domain-containing protein [Mycobacteriales bacterium]